MPPRSDCSVGEPADDPSVSETHHVYVLRCGDESLYTGYTTDPDRRLREHRRGTGAKYTRGRGPLTLVYLERFTGRPAAMRREHGIKQLDRATKRRLVAGERPAVGTRVTESDQFGEL